MYLFIFIISLEVFIGFVTFRLYFFAILTPTKTRLISEANKLPWVRSFGFVVSGWPVAQGDLKRRDKHQNKIPWLDLSPRAPGCQPVANKGIPGPLKNDKESNLEC